MSAHRFPRSLVEAFGPYTDDRVEPMRDNRPAGWLPFFGWAVIVLLIALCSLAGRVTQ